MEVIMPARFVAEKGHRYLVDAFALLRDRGSHVQAVLVGDGPLANDIRRQINERGLNETMLVQPAVPHDQLIGMIQKADLLVLASTQEGLPVAVLEAMSLGKPVVASAVGGVIDLVVQGETGFLVPPADPGSLAAALERLAENPQQRVAFGAAGRERFASRYTSSKVADEWRGLYRRLLSVTH
jgi:glycosyltransferase involved in cell wall biosynthesis